MAKGIINLQKASGGVTKISSVDGTGITDLVVPESGNLVSVNTAVTDNAIARYDGTTGKLQNSSVVIEDGGNVGIGTGNPIDKLTMYTASGNIFVRSQSGASTLLTGVYSDGSTCVNSLGNYPLILLTNNAERMRIDTNGNVLVTSPAGIGYGVGAGGTVTQLTSKGTAVTLNKPSGRITMNNAALASQADVYFTISNNKFLSTDGVVITQNDSGTYFGVNYDIKVVYTADGLIGIVVKNISASTLSDAVIFRFAVIKGANS